MDESTQNIFPNSLRRRNDGLPTGIRRAFESAALGFSVTRVENSPESGWAIRNGCLSHKSGGFFHVVGCRFSDARVDSGVLLYQPQSAITGLLGRVGPNGLELMLQARVEPGLLGIVQLAPTIQSTAANYMQLHGGRATPFIDYFTGYHPDLTVRQESTQIDLGDRYLMKSKRCSAIETSSYPEPVGNCFWVSPEELAAVLGESYVIDMDLRSALGLLPWSDCFGGFALVPKSETICRSLRAPLRGEVLGLLISRLGCSPAFSGFVDLRNLKNWTFDSYGMRETHRAQGFSLEFFETRTTSREVNAWTQPLVVTPGLRRVVLLLRRSGEHAEVLVRIREEAGLARGRCLSASVITSFKEPSDTNSYDPDLLIQTYDSAEGGRFYQQTVSYEIREGESDIYWDDGAWVSIAELKYLLGLSEVCSIELRAVASLLLAVEDRRS